MKEPLLAFLFTMLLSLALIEMNPCIACGMTSRTLAPTTLLYSGEVILLSPEEIRTYLGPSAAQSGLFDVVYLRQLDPKGDLHFLQEWREDYERDPDWQAEWEAGRELTESFPRFSYLEPLSFGVFSLKDGREKMQGFIGFELSRVGFREGHWIFDLFIKQMELYYKNIGKLRALPGLADLLMDHAIQFLSEYSEGWHEGISFYPVTPGSVSLGKRRGFSRSRDGNYVLESTRVSAAYETRSLRDRLSLKAVLNVSQSGMTNFSA